MMPADVRVRREARTGGDTCDPSRETFVIGEADLSAVPKAKAEGATAPETLRQKDRAKDDSLESEALTVFPPKG